MGEYSISGDEWASAIEDSGSSADSVSFGDRNISINDGGSSSGSSSSSTSGSDRYGTSTNSDGSYNVASGYVGAANAGNTDNGGSVSRDTGVQSGQLDQIEQATSGNIDKQSATLGGEGQADDALTVTTDQGETVTSTPTGNGQNMPEMPEFDGIGARAIIAGVVALVAIAWGS